MKRKLLEAGLVLAFALAVGAQAQETTLTLDSDKSTVSFTLEATLHTVHGTFRVKKGVIRFDPSSGATSGTIVVDGTSGETGNKRRDRTMHRDILQSELYPEITFKPTRVAGTFLPQGESSVQVEGVLRLLGTDHAITLPFKVQASAGELRAMTQFTVPYIAWGLKNPSTLLLRVARQVELIIVANGKLTSTAAQR